MPYSKDRVVVCVAFYLTTCHGTVSILQILEQNISLTQINTNIYIYK